MGVKKFLKKLVPQVGEEEQEEKKEKKADKDTCALCNQPNPEVKWMGQYWHKKCLRKAKKMAKKMV